MFKFKTTGVCSREVSFDVDEGRIKNVSFFGGCEGNLKGISKLVEGMELNEAINKLKGIKCGHKNTSCPDQLAKALEKYISEK